MSAVLDAAVRISWKLYPQSKPQGSDEAKLLGDSRRGFTSRFADYELHETNKYVTRLDWKVQTKRT